MISGGDKPIFRSKPGGMDDVRKRWGEYWGGLAPFTDSARKMPAVRSRFLNAARMAKALRWYDHYKRGFKGSQIDFYKWGARRVLIAGFIRTVNELGYKKWDGTRIVPSGTPGATSFGVVDSFAKARVFNQEMLKFLRGQKKLGLVTVGLNRTYHSANIPGILKIIRALVMGRYTRVLILPLAIRKEIDMIKSLGLNPQAERWHIQMLTRWWDEARMEMFEEQRTQSACIHELAKKVVERYREMAYASIGIKKPTRPTGVGRNPPSPAQLARYRRELTAYQRRIRQPLKPGPLPAGASPTQRTAHTRATQAFTAFKAQLKRAYAHVDTLWAATAWTVRDVVVETTGTGSSLRVTSVKLRMRKNPKIKELIERDDNSKKNFKFLSQTSKDQKPVKNISAVHLFTKLTWADRVREFTRRSLYGFYTMHPKVRKHYMTRLRGTTTLTRPARPAAGATPAQMRAYRAAMDRYNKALRLATYTRQRAFLNSQFTKMIYAVHKGLQKFYKKHWGDDGAKHDMRITDLMPRAVVIKNATTRDPDEVLFDINIVHNTAGVPPGYLRRVAKGDVIRRVIAIRRYQQALKILKKNGDATRANIRKMTESLASQLAPMTLNEMRRTVVTSVDKHGAVTFTTVPKEILLRNEFKRILINPREANRITNPVMAHVDILDHLNNLYLKLREKHGDKIKGEGADARARAADKAAKEKAFTESLAKWAYNLILRHGTAALFRKVAEGAVVKGPILVKKTPIYDNSYNVTGYKKVYKYSFKLKDGDEGGNCCMMLKKGLLMDYPLGKGFRIQIKGGFKIKQGVTARKKWLHGIFLDLSPSIVYKKLLRATLNFSGWSLGAKDVAFKHDEVDKPIVSAPTEKPKTGFKDFGVLVNGQVAFTPALPKGHKLAITATGGMIFSKHTNALRALKFSLLNRSTPYAGFPVIVGFGLDAGWSHKKWGNASIGFNVGNPFNPAYDTEGSERHDTKSVQTNVALRGMFHIDKRFSLSGAYLFGRQTRGSTVLPGAFVMFPQFQQHTIFGGIHGTFQIRKRHVILADAMIRAVMYKYDKRTSGVQSGQDITGGLSVMYVYNRKLYSLYTGLGFTYTGATLKGKHPDSDESNGGPFAIRKSGASFSTTLGFNWNKTGLGVWLRYGLANIAPTNNGIDYKPTHLFLIGLGWALGAPGRQE